MFTTKIIPAVGWCLAALTVFTACEKKEEVKPVDPPKTTIGALSVLNANSGYKTLYDSAFSLGGLYNDNRMGLNDFTLVDGNKLHLAYHTRIATQQSPFYTNYQVVVDINTAQELPPASGQSNLTGLKDLGKFFPYSDILVSIKSGDGSFGINNSIQFGQDISAGVSTPNPPGTGDLGFRYPVCNSGAGFGYFSKLTSGSTVQRGASFTMFNGAIGSQAKLTYYKGGCLHEVYTDGSTTNYIAIGVAADTVKVFRVDYTSFGTPTTYPVYAEKLINSMPTMVSEYGTLSRHYSNDGKTLSFLLKETPSNKISTYSYNFETNTLTQHLKQVTLEYSGTESDIDLDENGNVYYTGTAGNGSNTAGVSVYKKSSSGAPSLVGSDNILVSGTVVGLKVLNGKVYCAVTAKQSGKEVYQISIIKQD